MKKIFGFMTALSLAALLSTAGYCGEEWPAFRGGAARTGAVPERSARYRARGDVVWETYFQQPIQSSPALSEGVVYFGSDDGGFYAVSAASGETLWTFRTENWISSSPAVYGRG